jgi:rifampicin phosphotransferase
VLVQVMIDPVAAGVAFTAHPVTGDRDQIVVTAVPGLGEALVSGQSVGEEWTVTARRALTTRPGASGTAALTDAQAVEVADLARRVADRYARPQDIEWAIDAHGTLWLLQARPMTALPEPVSWRAPGPGLWMRNFRLGEWLPEAVTPLFGTWLLPVLEDGYLDGMQATVGVRVPFRYALVNGWYYNAPPIPSPELLARVIWRGRSRAVKTLYNALFRVGRDPAAADRAVLTHVHTAWREQHLPAYRRRVAAVEAEVGQASPTRLAQLVDELGPMAGTYLWYLAIVGGSAWKMEACLTRFCHRHLAAVLSDEQGGVHVLLRGLSETQPVTMRHAVHSVDWYHPVGTELPAPGTEVSDRHAQLVGQRVQAEHTCRAALARTPQLLARFNELLDVNQRYAVIREEQARDLTLAWPVLRACARRLGAHLVTDKLIEQRDDVFFCTRDEVTRPTGSLHDLVRQRRGRWQRERRLNAPLTLGRPPRLIGDVIDRAVRQARGSRRVGQDVIVGHPASAGIATGPVRIVQGPEDFADFHDGDVLVAKATAPAWTPLFARAAAVVTDGGTLAAHASLVAREYGIPAVVATGDATHRLTSGQFVTVDGAAGTVTLQPGSNPSESSRR